MSQRRSRFPIEILLTDPNASQVADLPVEAKLLRDTVLEVEWTEFAIKWVEPFPTSPNSLEAPSKRDALTGLSNRYGFLACVEQQMRLSRSR